MFAREMGTVWGEELGLESSLSSPHDVLQGG